MVSRFVSLVSLRSTSTVEDIKGESFLGNSGTAVRSLLSLAVVFLQRPMRVSSSEEVELDLREVLLALLALLVFPLKFDRGALNTSLREPSGDIAPRCRLVKDEGTST